MAQRIIYELKIIEIEHEQRHGSAVALSGGKLVAQAIFQGNAVKQSGKPIVVGNAPQFFFSEDALADIARGAKNEVAANHARQYGVPEGHDAGSIRHCQCCARRADFPSFRQRGGSDRGGPRRPQINPVV